MTCSEAAKPGASTEVTWSQPGDYDPRSPRSGRGAWTRPFPHATLKIPVPSWKQREERRRRRLVIREFVQTERKGTGIVRMGDPQCD